MRNPGLDYGAKLFGGVSVERGRKRMRRRVFITLLSAVVVLCPFAARAQQHFKIGLLDSGIAENFTVPFMQRLEQLGYVEGKNLVVERRFAEGDRGRLREFAADLVQQKVDVIVTMGTPA